MALNDPNWGRPGGSRGPGQGPPDLDELWRSFNRRLNDLFARRRGGGGEEPPRPPSPARFGGGLGILVGLIIAVWLASGFYIVDVASLEPAGPLVPHADVGAMDTLRMIFTSGTSGDPKAVQVAHFMAVMSGSVISAAGRNFEPIRNVNSAGVRTASLISSPLICR